MSENSLRLKNVCKRVGNFVLHADFEIKAGERVALLGPSGCGKTTVLRLIAGLDNLDSGLIELGLRDLTQMPPEKRKVGLVFQEATLFPTLNLIENVTFALKVQKIPYAEREALALPWLKKVGLETQIRESVQGLSGGERQRVAFIRAILSKPELLLLDEPFSALDSQLRKTLRSELVELHQLWPVPLLLVTHDEIDVASVATDCLIYEPQNSQAGSTSKPIRKFYR